LNDEALAAFARLLRRAEVGGGGAAEHFVFPGCENGALDFTRHQRSLHTAWRSLVKQAGTQAGREAARAVLESGGRIGAAKAAWKGAAQAFRGFRFHDLRHQSITEMAEAGVPDAAIQSIAGHLSKKMQDHYSHVRMAAKRQAVEALGGGLIGLEPDAEHAKGRAN
jgi:integrase